MTIRQGAQAVSFCSRDRLPWDLVFTILKLRTPFLFYLLLFGACLAQVRVPKYERFSSPCFLGAGLFLPPLLCFFSAWAASISGCFLACANVLGIDAKSNHQQILQFFCQGMQHQFFLCHNASDTLDLACEVLSLVLLRG